MSVATSTLGRDVKVIGLVGVAHGYSHFFQMVLPPIFVILKVEFDVSFTALGLLATLMFAASGTGQMIAGFLVDRIGARRILLSGLAICSLATLAMSVAQSYEVLVALAVVVGIGLSVFHPADLSILTRKVNPARLGRAYAVHALCGNLGWAVAPPFVAGLAALFDWRTAVASAGAAGLAYVAFMLFWSRDLADEPVVETKWQDPEEESFAADIRLLSSAPIVLCFCYFTFLAMAIIGVQSFGALSLMKLHGLPYGSATAALTAFIIASAGGVFVGGIIADRTPSHHVTAMIGTTLSGVFMFGVATAGVDGALGVLLRINHALARHDRAQGHAGRKGRARLRLRLCRPRPGLAQHAGVPGLAAGPRRPQDRHPRGRRHPDCHRANRHAGAAAVTRPGKGKRLAGFIFRSRRVWAWRPLRWG